jgi:2,4-dienoyl-CoA reductase-like NADH-dependent reductase (Old Yellow Enzyme family)
MISFKKFKIGNHLLKNRYVVSPMCQYSAKNGNPTDWHYSHLSKLAITGASTLMLESTAVNNEGKISKNDLTLKNKINEKNLKRLIIFLRKFSDIKIGIQLSHSGRKGSSYVPWVRSNFPLNKGKWETYAPSAIKRDKHWPIPTELNLSQINKIKNDFLNAAKRANRIGFDCLEIHMAHGYLLHQFFSKISNKRSDRYGGNLEKRVKLLIEISEAIRKVWPKKKILGARITGSDRLKKGNDVEDAIYLTNKLKKIGFNYVCVSSGGIIPKTNLKIKNGFNVDLAEKIKKKSKIIVRTSGKINNIDFANKLIKNKCVDLICIGKKFISEPNFLLKQMDKRLKKKLIPNQYKRCI